MGKLLRFFLFSKSKGKKVKKLKSFITLSDGRRLCYAEYGDPQGKPVFAFHGNPSSRLFFEKSLVVGIRSDLRIIAPDRPGFGRSDFKPGRKLLDWPDDVAEMADLLGIKRFAVVGTSDGACAALMCAWKIPQRLTAVGIVNAPAPPEVPGLLKKARTTNRIVFDLLHRAPWVMRIIMEILAFIGRTRPKLLVRMLLANVPECDQKIVSRPLIRKRMAKNYLEAFRQGGRGPTHELVLDHGRPWKIKIKDIKPKVYLWHCLEDTLLPPAMGRYLARTIPNCEAKFIPNAGHFWVYEHMNEVLDNLARHI